MKEAIRSRDAAGVSMGGDGAFAHDPAKWRIHWAVAKFHNKDVGDISPRDVPDEMVEIDRNALMYGGASCLWQCLIGNGTTTSGQTLTFFNNGNAAVGVGDSTTAVAATQTDLQAATNKLRKGMDSTYPQHTDGTTSAAASIVFKASFGTSEANFAWNEVGVFNSSSAGVGRMLNRLQQSFGTKSSGTWSMTVTISLS